MGTLTATGFLRASKAVEGKESLDTADVAAFWRAYRDGVAERGKAKVGDKTLLDVLDPVATTLEAHAAAGSALSDALSVTAEAAEQALEATKSMLAQHGKAAAFQEKTVGLQDAGATVGAFLIRRMADFVGRR
jgi:dihydroxyacetone kinase-like protein